MDEIPEERNVQNTLASMHEIVTSNVTHAFDVNRVTPLINSKKFDVVQGFVPDDMHFARIGLGKQYADYWIDRSKSPLSSVLTATDVQEIDGILNSIQAPN